MSRITLDHCLTRCAAAVAIMQPICATARGGNTASSSVRTSWWTAGRGSRRMSPRRFLRSGRQAMMAMTSSSSDGLESRDMRARGDNSEGDPQWSRKTRSNGRLRRHHHQTRKMSGTRRASESVVVAGGRLIAAEPMRPLSAPVRIRMRCREDEAARKSVGASACPEAAPS